MIDTPVGTAVSLPKSLATPQKRWPKAKRRTMKLERRSV